MNNTLSSGLMDAVVARIALQQGLVPRNTNPIYIVTPPYQRISAGVKVLHSLCHYLNLFGEQAFVVPYAVETVADTSLPFHYRFGVHPPASPALCTPVVTKEVAEYHFREKLTPLVIYPEVFDNPLKAPYFARYILNYPGLLSPHYQEKAHAVFAYSRKLADHVGCEDVLHIPAVDLRYFHDTGLARRGSCYYAGKYKSIYGGDVSLLPKNSVEIKRAAEMSTDEVREIFRRSELFYCYEDTALAIEAALCGCPTVFMPTAHFKDRPLAAVELGTDGFAWGDSPEEVSRAKATVGAVRPRIEALYRTFPAEMLRIIVALREQAAQHAYTEPVFLQQEPRVVYLDKKAWMDGNSLDETERRRLRALGMQPPAKLRGWAKLKRSIRKRAKKLGLIDNV